MYLLFHPLFVLIYTEGSILCKKKKQKKTGKSANKCVSDFATVGLTFTNIDVSWFVLKNVFSIVGSLKGTLSSASFFIRTPSSAIFVLKVCLVFIYFYFYFVIAQ